MRRKGVTQVSLQTIEMHFKEVTQLSRQLANLAKNLKAVGEEDIMRLVSEEKRCWNSECADVLTGKEVKLGRLLISEAERILKTAEEMEERAKKMYQAEMLSNQLAAVRVYL